MKTKTLVSWCVLSLALLIAAGNCATTTGSGKLAYERLYGTWVNNEYEGIGNPSVKMIFNPDGTGAFYKNLLVANSGSAFLYTVQKKWTDPAGDQWYHIISKDPRFPAETDYLLIKIEKNNRLLEYNYSNLEFPTTIDPKDMHSDYAMYYRF